MLLISQIQQISSSKVHVHITEICSVYKITTRFTELKYNHVNQISIK